MDCGAASSGYRTDRRCRRVALEASGVARRSARAPGVRFVDRRSPEVRRGHARIHVARSPAVVVGPCVRCRRCPPGSARRSAGRAHRPRDRRGAARSEPRRLADVAPDARRVGLQPPRPHRPAERGRAPHGVVPRPHRRAAAGNAPRARRRDVHAEPQRRHPGDRRGLRRPALGAPPGGARRHLRLHLRPVGEQPQPGHPRHVHPRHERRRPRVRARRGHRTAGVGDADRRLPRRPPRCRPRGRSSPAGR